MTSQSLITRAVVALLQHRVEVERWYEATGQQGYLERGWRRFKAADHLQQLLVVPQLQCCLENLLLL